ncbi:hypothetical protein MNBD_GAMMA21-872 [hydrothermal vent metagenome]|uniref:Tll0287-like domain-containing protein n=1 Tax=hydrothermal vent metagenome TaxID=652676 RepID=A0A3B0ZZI1_9ZZZZ
MTLNAFRIFLGLILGIYLFATAPAPLPANMVGLKTIPTKLALSILNQENNIARSLYTKEIVLAGKKQGLDFDENWKKNNLDAGPLPAQFLRETANHIEKSPQPIELYLGSDFPINSANRLRGKQMISFKALKDTQQPQFFFADDINRYIYMAADIAISRACISCHNEHKDSPKTSWKLNDIMGATTWTYPEANMDHNNLIKMIITYRNSVQKTYEQYLKKVSNYQIKPEVGTKWPRQGFYLPTGEVFMKRLEQDASTFSSIINIDRNIKNP